jgi:hypothetical protein
MDYQVPLHRLVRPRSRRNYRLDVLLFVLLTLLLLFAAGLSVNAH